MLFIKFVLKYDCITEQEYNEIVKIFELGAEYVEKHLSPQEVAVKILGEFMGRLSSEIRSFEFDLLPPEKQLRLLREQEEWRKKLNVRKCTEKNKVRVVHHEPPFLFLL